MDSKKVFISWSLDRSKHLANTVKWWLRQVIQASEPWVSTEDIEAGSRTMNEIESGLANTKFGIICVTPESVGRPWLNYESGALSKQVDENTTKVVPLLFDFKSLADVTGPIAQFQAVMAEQEGFLKLAHTLNGALGTLRTEEEIQQAHEQWWPELERRLNDMPANSQKKVPPARANEDMFREIVTSLRDLESKFDRLTTTRSRSAHAPNSEMSDVAYSNYSSFKQRREPDLPLLVRHVRSAVPSDINGNDVRVELTAGRVRVGTPRAVTEEESELFYLAVNKDFPVLNVFEFYSYM